MLYCVTGSHLFQDLYHQAFTRIESAYRPKTILAHKTHFTTFLQFCELISQLIALCDNFPYGLVYKPLFLCAFFGFLRLSNIVPTSVNSFDVMTHLFRADFIRSESHGNLVLKWSKTLQNQNEFKVIPLPILGPSPLCPISALQVMCLSIPADGNFRLSCVPQGLGLIPLTQNKVRKKLRALVSSLGLDPEIHSFHTFRRSEASFAYNNGIGVESVKKQGT